MFHEIYHFPMQFISSCFENRQLSLVSIDSSCSGWLRVATTDLSYDLRRLIWDLRLTWPPPEFWPSCPLIHAVVQFRYFTKYKVILIEWKYFKFKYQITTTSLITELITVTSYCEFMVNSLLNHYDLMTSWSLTNVSWYLLMMLILSLALVDEG